MKFATFCLMHVEPTICYDVQDAVEPVLSGTVLSGHPLLSGQLSKSRKLLPLITVILTCIKRSPLLSGRGHPKVSLNELISIVLTCFKRSLCKRKPLKYGNK